MNHHIPDLDRGGLRHFGLTTGLVVGVLFGLFFPWVFERPLPVWPWLIFGLLGALAIIVPNWLRPVYKGWMRFGLALSKITTPIIMGIIFFLLITPIALVLRIVGADSMSRRFDDSNSYRVASEPTRDDHLSKPY